MNVPVPMKVNVPMSHYLSWLRLEVGCRILTGRRVKLTVPVWPHNPSTTLQKASFAKDGGTEAGSHCYRPFYETVHSATRQYFLLALPSPLPSGLKPRQL